MKIDDYKTDRQTLYTHKQREKGGNKCMNYNNRETPLAGNFVGRCQGHKSDVSTQSWVLISEKDNVTISGGCLYTHEWRELVTGGEVRNGMKKIMAIII